MTFSLLGAIVRKDLQVFFADPRAVVVSFVLPLVLASFFGYLFGGGGERAEPSRVTIRLVDADRSDLSRRFAASLAADRALLVESVGEAAAREAVRSGQASAAVLIPGGFAATAREALLARGSGPELGLLFDPSHAAEVSLVEGLVTQHLMGAVAEGVRAAPRLEASTVSSGAVRAAGPQVPFQVRAQAVTAREEVRYNGYAHSFAGMGVQFILMAGLDGALAVLLQRQRGLWKRVRAAPLSRLTLLGGRLLSSAIIALLILGVLFTFGALVFGVRVEGSLIGFAAVCLASSLMAAAFGLLVAALGRTPEATRAISVFVLLVIVMLGGAWVPSFFFPAWLQRLAAVSPAKWAVDGMDAMLWRGSGLDGAVAPVAALLAFTVAFGLLAVWRFRWESE
jgi:ABC-2 type transport system permease protein